jgi:hypothetical protein
MVCSGTILQFIISKEGKTHNPKKIKALVKMPVPTSRNSNVQWNGIVLHMFYLKNCLYHGTNYQVIQENKSIQVDC